MTKPELIKAVSQWAGITQVEAESIVGRAITLIADAIRHEGRFAYPDFGTFKKVIRKACERPNPQDRSKKVKCPAWNTVTFKPAPALKELVK
jgi:nucleoid DNA-binding protein